MRCLRLSLLLCGCLAAAPAVASSSYVGAIQSHLGLRAPVPEGCALCHTNGVTGINTVNTPFGTSARALGLSAGSDTKLAQVLDAMAAAGTDSDGDGVSDVDELKAGTSPNMRDGSAGQAPLQFGCGAQAAPGAVGVGLLAWALRRRRSASASGV